MAPPLQFLRLFPKAQNSQINIEVPLARNSTLQSDGSDHEGTLEVRQQSQADIMTPLTPPTWGGFLMDEKRIRDCAACFRLQPCYESESSARRKPSSRMPTTSLRFGPHHRSDSPFRCSQCFNRVHRRPRTTGCICRIIQSHRMEVVTDVGLL